MRLLIAAFDDKFSRIIVNHMMASGHQVWCARTNNDGMTSLSRDGEFVELAESGSLVGSFDGFIEFSGLNGHSFPSDKYNDAYMKICNHFSVSRYVRISPNASLYPLRESSQSSDVSMMNLEVARVYSSPVPSVKPNGPVEWVRRAFWDLYRCFRVTTNVVSITQAIEQFVDSSVSAKKCTNLYVTDEQQNNGFYWFSKRIIDIAFVLFVSIFMFWLLLIVALLIKSTSPGPILFKQARVGKDGKEFILVKFRTMHLGTKNLATHEVSLSSVIPIGHFIRKIKIDELPQIWNIVRGELSLVGPRPCLPTQTELVDARKVRGVFDILPGITGIAQVMGVDMSNPHALAKLDEKYLKQRSLLVDIKILIFTAIGRGNRDWVR
ncbi:sugar transferase [Maritalea sp.]|jgi:lipopolysaccharide/colanic/teichoic acid biosynthesis glycosyltransferase|uniref:sugar transferase n=1 Tax=Maritalea sp. TaxID=2003361 RepID=UPI0039E526AD